MASHQFFHEITIARQPEVIFDYVTDPNHWHEWFSPSLPAQVEVDAREAGSRFQVGIMQRPFPPLPIRVERRFDCVVTKVDRPYLFELEAHFEMMDAITSYTLSTTEGGTVFTLQFRYTVLGWLHFSEHFIFRRRAMHRALISLVGLRQRLEQ